jgi:hypothetical protein
MKAAKSFGTFLFSLESIGIALALAKLWQFTPYPRASSRFLYFSSGEIGAADSVRKRLKI